MMVLLVQIIIPNLAGRAVLKVFMYIFLIFFICIMIQPRLAENTPYSFLSLLTPRTTVVCHTLGIDTLYKFQVTLLLLTFSLGDNKKKKNYINSNDTFHMLL